MILHLLSIIFHLSKWTESVCFSNAKLNSDDWRTIEEEKNDIPDCHKRKFKKYSGNKIATFDIIPAGTIIVQIFKHFNVPVPLGLSTIIDNSLYQTSSIFWAFFFSFYKMGISVLLSWSVLASVQYPVSVQCAKLSSSMNICYFCCNKQSNEFLVWIMN